MVYRVLPCCFMHAKTCNSFVIAHLYRVKNTNLHILAVCTNFVLQAAMPTLESKLLLQL